MRQRSTISEPFRATASAARTRELAFLGVPYAVAYRSAYTKSVDPSELWFQTTGFSVESKSVATNRVVVSRLFFAHRRREHNGQSRQAAHSDYSASLFQHALP